jgi:hypothetical protein
MGEGGTRGPVIDRPAWRPIPADREQVVFWGGLIALAVVAFLVRLLPVLYGGGLSGTLGHDDAVYFGAATAFTEGRLPYRDFNILHPPGIVYLLSPVALVGGLTGDTTAFGIARIAFMALGALNTVLVGLVARRAGLAAALCAAAIYAVWVSPAGWERTTYLIAPQSTFTLLALLLLGRTSDELRARHAALAGAAIGIAGVFQLWTAVTAVVLLGWLIATQWRAPRRLARLAAAYVAGGVVAAFVLVLPMLVLTGQRMIEQTVLAQLARTGAFRVGRLARLWMIEGIPTTNRLERLIPDALVVIALVAVAVLVAVVAWKRSEIRLWVALAAGQLAFLMITPVFFAHYAAWPAPAAALSIGATAATIIGWPGTTTTRRVAAGLFGVGLVALLVVSLRPVGLRFPVTPEVPDLRAARCVTADDVLLLITTETLRRDLERGCPLLLNPSGLVHLASVGQTGDKTRRDVAEYQLALERYFGSSDAAMFSRLRKDQLTPETWARIRAALPVEQKVGWVTVLLRAQP